MIVVGITMIRAKRLSGWRRFVPLLCPFWLPLAVVGTIAFDETGGYIGVGFAAVLWGLLGYVVVRSDSRRPAPTAVSAVQ